MRTAAIFTVLAAMAIVTIDEPLARWLATRDTAPALWNGGIAALEYAAGIEPWRWLGLCVLVAAAIAAAAVPRWRGAARPLAFVAIVHLAVRVLVLWLKPATGRLRPLEWLAHGGDTFWHGGFSFPSGHVAYFASLALPIAVAWPRARWPAFAVVAFTCLARVAVDAHFASDVLGAIALAAAVTWACSGALTWRPRASRR